MMNDFLDQLRGGGAVTDPGAETPAERFAREAVTGAVARKLPLYDTLWSYDQGGFRFTRTGQILLGALAAYGVVRFMGR